MDYLNSIDFYIAFANDLGFMIGAMIAGTLSLLAALIGLGWGITKFLKWVTGGTGGFMPESLRRMEVEHDFRNRTWKGGGNEM